jgi:uncharacterized membrane protein YfcA
MMEDVSPVLVAIVGASGVVAGGLGSLLGLGGGVFLVPLLVLGLGLPMPQAVAISLTTVVATSSVVAARVTGQHLINLRLGMLLEVATAAGGLLGGLTATSLTPATLQRLFAIVMVAIAGVTLARRNRRNVHFEHDADPGRLGGRFADPQSGREVTYRVKRLPLALLGSFVAGNLSSLLGIGGGVLKVPLLNAWCGVPLRVAAATSALMIGVTAVPGAIIYFGNGQLRPALAAAAVLGVQAGAPLAVRLGLRLTDKSLSLLLVAVMLMVAASMIVGVR